MGDTFHNQGTSNCMWQLNYRRFQKKPSTGASSNGRIDGARAYVRACVCVCPSALRLLLVICEITFRSMWIISYKNVNKKNKRSPLFRLSLLAELYESIRSRDELDCGLRRREELSHEDILHSQDLNSETVTKLNYIRSLSFSTNSQQLNTSRHYNTEGTQISDSQFREFLKHTMCMRSSGKRKQPFQTLSNHHLWGTVDNHEMPWSG
jgi:hypothetical protein